MAHTDVERLNGYIIRRLHSKDGSHIFGYLTVPENYDGTDPSKVKEFASMGEAIESLVEYVYTKVDKYNGSEIFAVREKGYTRVQKYLIQPEGIELATLTEARKLLGVPVASTPKTLPKSAHIHNQKGYRADSHKGK